MSNRLELIASLIPDGVGVADVGTDHAYLPMLLAGHGYRGNITATDINEAPLKKARNNLIDAGLDSRVELVLCDGLDGCDPEKTDTVVIAGMGGDTITGILDRAEWCAGPGISLILQPATKSEILRYWLVNNGFVITKELITEENSVLYQIICAEAGEYVRYSDAELYTGRYEQIKDSPYFKRLVTSLIKRFESAVGGLTVNKRGGLDAWLAINETILEELREMNRQNEDRK